MSIDGREPLRGSMARSEIFLTAADHLATVTATPGDVLTISLAENPSTGFLWELDRTDADVLELLDSNHVAALRSGGGGQRVFKFKALRPGDVHLALKRWRNWEKDPSIAERFELTVHVAGR